MPLRGWSGIIKRILLTSTLPNRQRVAKSESVGLRVYQKLSVPGVAPHLVTSLHDSFFVMRSRILILYWRGRE